MIASARPPFPDLDVQGDLPPAAISALADFLIACVLEDDENADQPEETEAP